MNRVTAGIQQFDVLNDMSGYARPTKDFGEAEVSNDHVANLEKILEMLITRRRYLAQDAIVYPAAYGGRSQDIARMQPVIEAMRAAIADEMRMLDRKP